ncbi:hypothetical protein FOL46_005711 [Perkinsus olseni]|uniref:Uncharacterized protein n=2 Tax=Perkinsus olseni TaxID=32597 RepID=A0A7J6MRZ7_PEROL|nr:hypothetical protein FOL46_005711 [Perkinsus olseni]
MPRHATVLLLTCVVVIAVSFNCWRNRYTDYSDSPVGYSHCCDPLNGPEGRSGCFNGRSYTYTDCCLHAPHDGFTNLTDEAKELGISTDFNLVKFLTAPPFHEGFIELFPFICSLLRDGRYSAQCDILATKWFSHVPTTEEEARRISPAWVCSKLSDNADFCMSIYARMWQHTVWRRDLHRGQLTMAQCTYAMRLLYAMGVSLAADDLDPSPNVTERTSRMTMEWFYWWWSDRMRRCEVLNQQRERRAAGGDIQVPATAAGAPPADRVGILMSVAYNTKETPMATAAVEMWRCYADFHGYSFILDDDAHDSYDGLYAVRYPSMKTEVAHRISNHEPVDVNLVSPPSVGWMKWRAARRWLGEFDALIIVDPDMLVSFPCYSIALHHLLRQGADVVLRDYPPKAELNAGFAIVRNTPNGRFFLDSLLSKAAWYGLTLADQDALAETALQYVSHEVNNELPQESSISVMNPIRYASQCLDTMVLYKTGLYSEADQVVCFQKHLTILAGQWGARTTRSIRFVDPREIDINYRVTLTSRINGTPMVVHWAGSATKFEDMSLYVHRLARVNISTITKSEWPRVCREELWSSHLSRTCTPGSTEDLWCDSYLCGCEMRFTSVSLRLFLVPFSKGLRVWEEA